MPNTQIVSQPFSATLHPFVKRLFVVESTAPHSDSHLPDPGLVAVFRFGGVCQFPDSSFAPQAAITGLWDRRRNHMHSRDYAAVIVTFTPTGAAAFWRQPLDEFANATTDLTDVLEQPTELERLAAGLTQANTHMQRLDLVAEFLLTQLDASRVDPIVTAAVSQIKQAQAEVRIAALAQELGLSQSALERRFRRAVGATPRQFVTLLRLQRVLHWQTTGANLTALAHNAGYYDQSHFIKDFKRMTGEPPATFFARTTPQ